MALHEFHEQISDSVRNGDRNEIEGVITDSKLPQRLGGMDLDVDGQFEYRVLWSNNNSNPNFSRLEKFLVSMYGPTYFDDPESTAVYYEDILRRSQQVGEVALFASLGLEKDLSFPRAVTIGYIREWYPPTSAYQQVETRWANFNNHMGVSGLIRVRLGKYQKIALDADGSLIASKSQPCNPPRMYPYIAEHMRLYDDLSTSTERKDCKIGQKEIEQWGNDHPIWREHVANMYSSLVLDELNPHPAFRHIRYIPIPEDAIFLNEQTMEQEANEES